MKIIFKISSNYLIDFIYRFFYNTSVINIDLWIFMTSNSLIASLPGSLTFYMAESLGGTLVNPSQYDYMLVAVVEKVTKAVVESFLLIIAISFDVFYIPIVYLLKKYYIVNSPVTANRLVTLSDPFSVQSMVRQSSPQAVSLPTTDFTVIRQSFDAFIGECEREILPIYERHESGFDRAKIHSRMHACRSVLIGEVLSRFYHAHGMQVDFTFARRLTGLHDSGRQGNGVDVWEGDSANILRDHLLSKGASIQEAARRSRYIVKEEVERLSPLPIEYIIFQSADCLDIMRPCCGIGKDRFRVNLLSFLSNKCPLASTLSAQERHVIVNTFIDELWEFIQETENIKHRSEFRQSNGFINRLLNIAHHNPNKYPILNIYL